MEKISKERNSIIKKEEEFIKRLIKKGLSKDEIYELTEISKTKIENIVKKINNI